MEKVREQPCVLSVFPPVPIRPQNYEQIIKWSLADKSHCKTVDLRLHSQVMIDTTNATVPRENPVVCEDHVSTDLLTQRAEQS